MKITIVVPVYNVELYIEDCLKSIAAQTYKGKLECIIVDDCTQDNSCAVIEHFIKEYKGTIDFKLLHHNVNLGLSAARNTGIDAATGEYIYFLDSDDEITPECIELLAEPLKNKKYDFVIGNYENIGLNLKFPPLLLECGALLENKKISNTFFTKKWYMMAWNKLCNLKFIRKEKLYFKDGLIHEDELWSFQLACTAQSMYIVKERTYIYKVRNTSIMSTVNSTKTALSIAIITQEAYSWSKNKNILSENGVFNKILYYRELVISTILSQKTYKEKKELYLNCYKKLRLAPWLAYKKKCISRNSLIKEFYNYMPGIIGLWYLSIYQRIKGRL